MELSRWFLDGQWRRFNNTWWLFNQRTTEDPTVLPDFGVYAIRSAGPNSYQTRVLLGVLAYGIVVFSSKRSSINGVPCTYLLEES